MRFKIPTSHIEGAKKWLEDAESHSARRKDGFASLPELVQVRTDDLENPKQSPRKALGSPKADLKRDLARKSRDPQFEELLYKGSCHEQDPHGFSYVIRLNQIMKTNELLHQNLQQHQEQIRLLKAERRHLTELLGNNEEERRRLTIEVLELKEALAALGASKSVLEANMRRLNQTSDDAHRNLAAERKRLSELSQSLGNERETCAQLQRLLLAAEATIAVKDGELREAREEREAFGEATRLRLETMEGEMGRLAAECTDQRGQLGRARGLLEEMAGLPVYERALFLQRPVDAFFRPHPAFPSHAHTPAPAPAG